MLRKGVGESFAALVGGCRAGFALKFEDLGFAFGVLREPIGGHAALFVEIGTDEAGVERLVFGIDFAVHDNNRDLGALGFEGAHYPGPSRR